MKTLEITLYRFEELSEEAKNNAINTFLEGAEFDYIYDDARATLKEFEENTEVRSGHRDMFSPSLDHFNDKILDLKGVRLRTWILNNWGWFLYDRKYLGVSKREEGAEANPRPHTMKIFHKDFKGLRYCMYYSNIQTDNSCVLTGVCYDDSLLKPIYDFIKNPCPHADLEYLINDCYKELEKDIESEIAYRESTEGITEELREREEIFTEDGDFF
jgi:hypothetical protein